MASLSNNVPDSLRFIRQYVQRAEELEKTYPLIAYFCKMQAISKIISQGAHNHDTEAAKYAEQLMTDLEAVRQGAELTASDRDILENEQKSQDYVLRFASGVLARAQNQIAQHTVTQSTAMTLLAASTFLDLVGLWPGKDQSEQIKFAKYHAARILKAVKQGDDPNDLYEDRDELESELDALVKSTEVEKDQKEAGASGSVESGDGGVVGPTSEDSSSLTSKQVHNASDSPSPILPSAPSDVPKISADHQPSSPSSGLPSVPGELPGHKLPETPNKQPNNLGLPEAPEQQPSVVFEYERPPPAPTMEEFGGDDINTKPDKVVKETAKPPQNSRVVSSPPEPASQTASAPTNVASILSQAQVTKSAQKHAKFAISALNYDDYKTAIAELENALKVLRASESSQ